MSQNKVRDNKKRKFRYGFYGRLSAEFPSQIIVDNTEICNLACIHCAHSIFKRSKYYSGRCLDPDLNGKLVDEVREHGKTITQYLRYSSSGEPLVDPHIYEMLDYAVQNSGTMVALTTNGTLMTERKIERLLATGVNAIDISIDAFKPQTYAKIRVNGNLNITQANVLMLIKKVKEIRAHTKVVVSYIEQPENIEETGDFKIFWEASGADYVVIRRLHSNSGAIVEVANSMRNKNRNKVRRPCLYPWERIVLNPRGYLSFCPADWTHGSTMVDYRAVTIHEIWQGEFYPRLRDAHLSNSFVNHPFCGQCPDWRETRWPREGRSYADMMEEFKDRR